MLQRLRDHRSFISYLLLLAMGVAWFGLASASCNQGADQRDMAVHCCCDETGAGAVPHIDCAADDHCVGWQAGDCRPQRWASVGDRLQTLPAVEPEITRVGFSPGNRPLVYSFPPTSCAPRFHPAQRFRVLLI